MRKHFGTLDRIAQFSSQEQCSFEKVKYWKNAFWGIAQTGVSIN
jgi:hypothetical protein